MVQKIQRRGVIWVPITRLMWADQLKTTDSSSVHILRSPWVEDASEAAVQNEKKRPLIFSAQVFVWA